MEQYLKTCSKSPTRWDNLPIRDLLTRVRKTTYDSWDEPGFNNEIVGKNWNFMPPARLTGIN
jgi:hypothetical protein